MYKDKSSRKIDSRRLFSREYDFPKTFSLTENQISGKNYFYTIASRYYNYALSINGKEERHGEEYESDYLTDVIGRKAHAFLERARNGA